MLRHFLWVSLIAVTAAAVAQESVDMKLVPSGAMQQFGGYMPQQMKLSDKRPASITKLPPDLKAPQFASMPFRLAGGQTSVAIVSDDRGDQPPAIFVDANGNGDLTDDPPVKWEAKNNSVYMAKASLPIGEKEHPTPVTVMLYRFHDNPQMADVKDTIFCYGDYGVFGTITLAGKSYKAALNDMRCTGDFSGQSDAQAKNGVLLLIDTNGSGKLSRQPGTSFEVKKPFNIAGITYELHDLTADGHFTIVRSSQHVDEIPPPPNLSVGQAVPSFTATTMDGKTVNFPGDYKGHLVMLDFWATWCGPCMGEVPGVVTAYEKFHGQGFDVLGVSLDGKDKKHVEEVLKEKKMLWPEIYDGKTWDAAIAKQYGIRSIPSPILVDGDTGKIVATESGLRGDALEPTIQKALAARTKQGVQ